METIFNDLKLRKRSEGTTYLGQEVVLVRLVHSANDGAEPDENLFGRVTTKAPTQPQLVFFVFWGGGVGGGGVLRPTAGQGDGAPLGNGSVADGAGVGGPEEEEEEQVDGAEANMNGCTHGLSVVRGGRKKFYT